MKLLIGLSHYRTGVRDGAWSPARTHRIFGRTTLPDQEVVRMVGQVLDGALSGNLTGMSFSKRFS
jgi:hypothetical protein